MNDRELLEKIQKILLLMVARIEELDLTKIRAQEILLREIAELLDQVGVSARDALPQIIADSYLGGLQAAEALVVAERVQTAAQRQARPFPRQMHLAAVEQILDDTLLDFQAALRTAAENADKTIIETLGQVRDEFAKGLIHGDNRTKVTKRVAETFAKNGMTAFRTVDGRMLPLDFYAMTVTRTKIRTAHVAGSLARYQEMGVDLVQIRGNLDSCAVCARHRGIVLSLTGETPGYPVAGEGLILLPPFHPNCRCNLHPFSERGKTAEEIRQAKARGQNFDPEADPRTPAQKAAYEDEQRKRRIARQELKAYANWTAVLGDKAPGNIGAFRRMKRQNTKRFQELKKEYNRALRGGNHQ